jgi:hypothetical protein
LRAAPPAPYPDASPITGHVYALNTHHPLSGVSINYGTGGVITDQNGFYSIPFLAPGSYNLTPNGWGLQSFSPPSRTGVATGTNGMDFTGTVDSDLSPGSLYTEAIQGDYAYLGANGWLYIVNIQNKAAPFEASRLWIDQANIRDIVVSGHYAYLASSWDGGAEVNVVDVSDPANPVWVSSEPVLADNLAVYGQYLVMASSRYLYIYQQATSPAPHFLTRLVTLDPGSVNAAYWVAVSGHYAYVTGSQGLYIYDITNPAHPSAPWHYPAFWGYYTLVVDGQYAYLGYDDGDMLILDVADPAHVYQVSMPVTDSVRLAKAGNYLYAVQPSSEKKLIIVDVSNPYIPTQPGSYAFTGTTVDVQVQENYAFVLEQISGSSPTSHLDILDVSDKATPVEVGSYTPAP